MKEAVREAMGAGTLGGVSSEGSEEEKGEDGSDSSDGEIELPDDLTQLDPAALR